MKVSFSWLKELVEINIGVLELSERLSIAGFEVEEIIDLSLRAKGLVVGCVKDVSKHPMADKLKICKVDVGNEILQIVCGAKNVKKDIHVFVAIEGSYLGAIDLEIKKSNLRGIKSEGMICSLGEIGYESKEEGIAVLEDMNIQIPKLGTLVSKLLDLEDSIIDFAITANRPDGMSMVGIAREISALTNSRLTIPNLNNELEIKEFTPSLEKNIIGDEELYTISYISNINGRIDSPVWIKNKLHRLNIKPKNLIIDITNYLMMEQGQPLHAFDADLLNKLANKSVLPEDFGTRNAKDKEEFETIDGKIIKLNNSVAVVTCCDIPIALAGVIGSLNSAVNKNTKNIWLEGAVFNQTTVRNSSREIGLRTEASTRFEKGIPLKNTINTIERSISILKKYSNLECKNIYVNKIHKHKIKEVLLRRDRVHQILGPLKSLKRSENNSSDSDYSTKNYSNKSIITDNQITSILTLLGCKLIQKNDSWAVQIPVHREFDLTREIDLIEELGRLIGYDKFDSNLPVSISSGYLNPKQKIDRRLKNNFCITGFQEVVTSSLVSSNEVQSDCISISNPLFIETSKLRTNLWKAHIDILKKNISHGSETCWLYEFGNVYANKNLKYSEESQICGLLYGKKNIGRWQSNDKESDIDYFEARGKLTQALGGIFNAIEDKKIDNNELLHPGKSACLNIEGKSFGYFGQIHPLQAEALDIPKKTFIFSLRLNNLLEAATRTNKLIPRFREFPVVPFMERDISLILSESYTSAEIISIIKKAGKPLLEKVELLDRYEGENLSEGLVSQAFRIRYRKIDSTLTEEEINPTHEKIRLSLEKKFKANLRS